jgi:hypothetical protein
MIDLTIVVNSQANLIFKATTGTTTFPDLLIFQDGNIVTSPSITITEYSTTGVFVFRYTPLATGTYLVYVAGQIIGQINVVAKLAYTYLKNIEDESLGSWSWNKQTGTLNMIRQDGSPLTNYNVVETLTLASRELI